MHFYQRAEERLAHVLMEDFQRRGSTLLQVGLHSCIQPEFFWDSGFDVTATDEKQKIIELALERSGPRISYQIAKNDYLPFDDDSFDYVFYATYIYHCYFYQEEQSPLYTFPQDYIQKFYGENGILQELCRVARRGVLIISKNAFSLFSIKHYGVRLNPYTLWRKGKAYCPKGSVRFASTGFLPRFIPNKLRSLNNAVSFLPFGALIGISLNFNAPTISGIGALWQNECKSIEHSPCVQRNSIK